MYSTHELATGKRHSLQTLDYLARKDVLTDFDERLMELHIKRASKFQKQLDNSK